MFKNQQTQGIWAFPDVESYGVPSGEQPASLVGKFTIEIYSVGHQVHESKFHLKHIRGLEILYRWIVKVIECMQYYCWMLMIWMMNLCDYDF